jgi:hypothetical protein
MLEFYFSDRKKNIMILGCFMSQKHMSGFYTKTEVVKAQFIRKTFCHTDRVLTAHRSYFAGFRVCVD